MCFQETFQILLNDLNAIDSMDAPLRIFAALLFIASYAYEVATSDQLTRCVNEPCCNTVTAS